MASIMGTWGPLPPLEALGVISVRGATLAAAHADPGLPWLGPLSELFSCGYAAAPDAVQPSASDWSVSCVVRRDLILRMQLHCLEDARAECSSSLCMGVTKLI